MLSALANELDSGKLGGELEPYLWQRPAYATVKRRDTCPMCLRCGKRKPICQADIEGTMPRRMNRDCRRRSDQTDAQRRQGIDSGTQITLVACRPHKHLGVVDQREQQWRVAGNQALESPGRIGVVSIAPVERSDYDIGIEHTAAHARSPERSCSR